MGMNSDVSYGSDLALLFTLPLWHAIAPQAAMTPSDPGSSGLRALWHHGGLHAATTMAAHR